MVKTSVLQEVRLMRFTELYSDRQGSRLTQEEAARILGVHERTFRRYCKDYELEGAEGLYGARLDRIADNAAPVLSEFLNYLYQVCLNSGFFQK